MTLDEKLEVARRATEAGFFGARPRDDYANTSGHSPEERMLFRRLAYLARSLFDDLSADELFAVLWEVTHGYAASDYDNSWSMKNFAARVERALAGGPLEPERGEPWVPLRKTTL